MIYAAVVMNHNLMDIPIVLPHYLPCTGTLELSQLSPTPGLNELLRNAESGCR